MYLYMYVYTHVVQTVPGQQTATLTEYYDIRCVFTHTHIHIYIYIYIYMYIVQTVPVQQTATHLCGICAVDDARDLARNVLCI